MSSNQTQETPTFTKLFDGTLLVDTTKIPLTKGAFGTRTLIPLLSGKFTDPKDGTEVAKFADGVGGEFGVIGSDGVFYVDVRLVLQWAAGGLGFVEVKGVGAFGVSNIGHLHLETDSEKWKYLCGKFMICKVNFSTVPPTIGVYVQAD